MASNPLKVCEKLFFPCPADPLYTQLHELAEIAGGNGKRRAAGDCAPAAAPLRFASSGEVSERPKEHAWKVCVR